MQRKRNLKHFLSTMLLQTKLKLAGMDVNITWRREEVKRILKHFLMLFFLITAIGAAAQKSKKDHEVYVDKNGVLRYTKSGAEATFFGVNYTVPFAYGYRSVQRLGVAPEKAIDDDVYHMARLGFNAFRVHVWDNEIADSAGNLLNNEHLRLFDYLISKLKERGIKVFLTPLAYWRGGYPEPEPNTGAFSSLYDKREVLVREAAIKAQENYLKQLLQHVNPYTKSTYGDDKDVIALEINNEPHHSGPREGVAQYIDRMLAAVRSTGWNKPIFYNISESPTYAGVVAAAAIDGVSFQWYPTGLVANRTLKGNYLPNVDNYKIPFGDSLPLFRNKAKMVYEFDAGDVMGSYMYPAMARSFRSAGFQWATQFAYDPMATAYGNTEYQTHYVNLAYTPSKAISLLIAGKAFHQVPRGKKYAAYPTDSTFEDFRVSYLADLSDMNSQTEFYYSNTTTTAPKNSTRLQHIAGVGSSPVVRYSGYGAYFLDKISEGVWRLEVMPAAIHIRDPFAKASPQKGGVRKPGERQTMQVQLPDLGSAFTIQALNKGNTYTTTATNGQFSIKPGTYLLHKPQKEGEAFAATGKIGVIGMTEFVAPQPFNTTPFVAHQPFEEVSFIQPFIITAKAVGVDSADRLTVEIRNSAGKWKTVTMQRNSAYDYSATVPADMVHAVVINYRIMLQKGKETFYVYPGNHKGAPYAWDAYTNESYQTFVASTIGAPLELFNATADWEEIALYNGDWRNNVVTYVTTATPRQLQQRMTIGEASTAPLMGWHHYIGDRVAARKSELQEFKNLVLKVRDRGVGKTGVRVALIDQAGVTYTAQVPVDTIGKEISIPLSSFKIDASLLLPRPYPGFLPLWFSASATHVLDISKLDKLELSFTAVDKGASIDVESIYLSK